MTTKKPKVKKHRCRYNKPYWFPMTAGVCGYEPEKRFECACGSKRGEKK